MVFEHFEYYDVPTIDGALIKVIGVGGGGGNAVNHMVSCVVKEVVKKIEDNLTESTINSNPYGRIEFYSVNTDAKALRTSKVPQTIQIGGASTKGLGAGANPNVGRKAAEDDQEAIRAMLEGADMVFIAAGMGGGTGTGAAPVIAQIAKELGILTIAVVTKPFDFEGKKRMAFAEQGIKELAKYVDSTIVIPNQKLRKVLDKNISLPNAFAAVDDVLRNAVTGISDMITSPGFINVDFADIKTVMSEKGRAMMGTGIAYGSPSDDRAEKAAKEAIASPLLENVDLSGARGVVVNITAGMDLGLDEFHVVGETIKSFAAEDATVIVGTALVPEMEDELRVTIVVTGIGDNEAEEAPTTGYTPIKPAQSGSLNPLGQPTMRNPTDLSSRKDILDTPVTARARSLNDNEHLMNFIQRKNEE